MPEYEIEQYELRAQKYRVKAASPAQAIVKLWAGRAVAVDNGLELIEVPDDYGLSVDDNPEIANELLRLAAVRGTATCIPGIRAVEVVDEDADGN